MKTSAEILNDWRESSRCSCCGQINIPLGAHPPEEYFEAARLEFAVTERAWNESRKLNK
jgi:hypothetical protein